MANTYLSRTGISGANQKKWTFSGWFKKSSNGSELRLLTSSNNSSYDDTIKFKSADKIEVVFNNAIALTTNRLFRDNNAYYHIVVKVDTDQVSANDRVVLYINGVDERTVGGYSTSNMPNQGVTGYINYNAFYIGVTNPTANSNHFNGIMSHVHFTDGYAYDASAFGETDSTTGEWKIKTSPSVSYGTTGFWILKDGNSVTDASPNTNNFTVAGGTLTKTEDCPSNVYVTLNSLDSDLTASDKFEYGNTKVNGQTPADRKYYCSLTMPFEGNGKYYFEGVMLSNAKGYLGLTSLDAQQNPSYHRRENEYCGRYDYDYGYNFENSQMYKNTSGTAYSSTSWSANDYFSFAIDNTNQKMYIAKNGSWINSANPSNGTGGFDYSAIGNNVMFVITDNTTSNYNKFAFNFGNGSINGATISTTYSPTVGDTGAKFKYNIIPTGFTALSTKGMNA